MDIEDVIEEKYTNWLNCETDELDLTIEEAKHILVNDHKQRYVDDLLEESWKIVLSELEKKDKEIKQLKSMELKAKYGIASITLEGLINLENEIKKKDKIINEMANKLVEAHSWFYSEFDNFSKEDFIKYFTNKVTDINVGE